MQSPYISTSKETTPSFFEVGLMLINMILMAIWATKDTIALRNIALVLGAILAVIYLVKNLQFSNLKR
jgi:hypothetical protein